jgi:hypothetical protein
MEPFSHVHLYSGKGLVPPNIMYVRILADCKELPQLAFVICSSSLKTVDVLVGLEIVGDRSFYQCCCLTTIQLPYTVRAIGDAAFFSCGHLKSVELHNHGLLQVIGRGAFFWCQSLLTMTIPESVTVIKESAFNGCERLVSVKLSPKGLQVLGPMAFAQCTALIYIVIPSTVHVIESSTFLGCRSLRKVKLSQVQRIGNSAFRNCTSLTHMRLPVTLKILGNHSFSGCCKLLSAELPKTLQEIGDYAFSSCSSLKNIVVPSSVETEGRCVFGNCLDDFPPQEVPEMLRKRFEGLPLHNVCYFHTYDPNVMDQIQQAMEQAGPTSNCNSKMADCFGLTPFHILALSTTPNKDVWITLLSKHKGVQHLKDHWGHSPLDYLYMHDKSNSTDELIKCVVRNPLVWSNGRSRY